MKKILYIILGIFFVLFGIWFVLNNFVPYEDGQDKIDWNEGSTSTVDDVPRDRDNDSSGEQETKEDGSPPAKQDQPDKTPRAKDGCVITGCSSQVCADEEVITDCLYKEEYICYQKATCERQDDDQCGWTITKDIQACFKQFQDNGGLNMDISEGDTALQN